MPVQAGIQAESPEATAYSPWIPGLALLAQNDRVRLRHSHERGPDSYTSLNIIFTKSYLSNG